VLKVFTTLVTRLLILEMIEQRLINADCFVCQKTEDLSKSKASRRYLDKGKTPETAPTTGD
jgi:hypothetical protein